ncbi:alpha/beta hydrolase [Caulobacter sp.]|uniref:alpha/beta fold hydrolase n=1 Tax=Caulobacter sp. TaxID=78 RepID=UPI002B46703E|nr:alpha/beta hydrolase [Caulobacter sp.]HJV40700.1 alpha/beta hydrolase [Caulobacter sp.]
MRPLAASGAARASIAVPVRGGVLHGEVSGEGPAALFLHGWTLDRRMWRPQVEVLSSTFRVAAIDRRGFGASTPPPDLDQELDDILAVLDALAVDRCALIGMSQGGRVALRFADRRPDRLWGLVLQSAPLDGFAPGPRPEEAIPLDAYRDLVRGGAIDAMRAAWSSHPLMAFPGHLDRSALDAMLEAYDGRDLGEVISPRGEAPDLARRLDTIAVPALVITGEHDPPWLQLVGDALAYGLPQGGRQVMADAGHMSNLSHPEAFNAAVGAFLGDTAVRS